MILKSVKFLGWLIFGPIVWFILSICAAIILAIALFQMAVFKQKLSPQKNYGLTPPDKSIIVLN